MQGDVVYRGHLQIPKYEDEQLKSIPNDEQNDRLYIRKLFEAIFDAEDLKDQFDFGAEKSHVINTIEGTADYLTMKGTLHTK